MTNQSVKSLISQLKGEHTETEIKPYIDYQETKKNLEDIDYFVNHALKYRDTASILRAASACHDLGSFLESKVKKD
jgi:hypothetical protein